MNTEIALRDKRHLLRSDLAVKPPEGSYGYESALAAAGVTVLAYEQFGSYQGDWWAHIEFPNKERYFVTGSYGSCSGCDAFEAEFGWKTSEEDPDYLHKLRDFGRDYLLDCMTFEQAVSKAGENSAWDTDADAMVEWVYAQSRTSLPAA